METLTLFLTLALVHFVALITPGPDFFFVSQTAVSRSRHEALLGVIGITLGVAVWAAIALLGLNLILLQMAWLHQGIMIAGGLFLAWMGWQMLKSARRGLQPPSTEGARVLAAPNRAFMKGLLTNLSNPKAVIYFGSVFSLFVGDNVGSTARWGLFALIISETFIWFTLVAILFASPAMRRGYQRVTHWIDGIAGLLFCGFGIHLLLSVF